jgi:hypothetical protein
MAAGDDDDDDDSQRSSDSMFPHNKGICRSKRWSSGKCC